MNTYLVYVKDSIKAIFRDINQALGYCDANKIEYSSIIHEISMISYSNEITVILKNIEGFKMKAFVIYNENNTIVAAFREIEDAKEYCKLNKIDESKIQSGEISIKLKGGR